MKISYLVPLISQKIRDILCFLVANSSVSGSRERLLCVSWTAEGSKGRQPPIPAALPSRSSAQAPLQRATPAAAWELRLELPGFGSALALLLTLTLLLQDTETSLHPMAKKQGTEKKLARKKLPLKNQVIYSNAQTWQLVASFIHRPLKYLMKEWEVSTIWSLCSMLGNGRTLSFV